MKNTVSTFLSMKQNGERLTEITSYDYTTAKLVEKAGINAILVGDSLGMTMMGYDTTLPVTMEDMIHHSACVVRACENTMVIMDMPFMSYQASVSEAVRNAGRLMKEARGHAVKMEFGAAVDGFGQSAAGTYRHDAAERQCVRRLLGTGQGRGSGKAAARGCLHRTGGRCIFGRARVRTAQAGGAHLEKADHPDHRHRRGRRL